MFVRVVRIVGKESVFVGNFETTAELPAVGDTFWYDTLGPCTVKERAFIYKKGRDDDRPEDVILTVKEIEKAVSPTAVFGTYGSSV
jgi:hypothetical protein